MSAFITHKFIKSIDFVFYSLSVLCIIVLAIIGQEYYCATHCEVLVKREENKKEVIYQKLEELNKENETKRNLSEKYPNIPVGGDGETLETFVEKLEECDKNIKYYQQCKEDLQKIETMINPIIFMQSTKKTKH